MCHRFFMDAVVWAWTGAPSLCSNQDIDKWLTRSSLFLRSCEDKMGSQSCCSSPSSWEGGRARDKGQKMGMGFSSGLVWWAQVWLDSSSLCRRILLQAVPIPWLPWQAKLTKEWDFPSLECLNPFERFFGCHNVIVSYGYLFTLWAKHFLFFLEYVHLCPQ